MSPSPRLPSDLWPELASSTPQPVQPYGIPSGVGMVIEPSRRDVLAGGAAAASVGGLFSTQALRVSTGEPDAISIALAEIRRYEGWRGRPVLYAYDDKGWLGPDGPRPIKKGDKVRGTLTIGWGRAYGVEPGQTCTEAQADAWLMDDVNTAMAAVYSVEAECRRRGHPDFTPEMSAALCSFAFNIGWHAFKDTRSVAGRLRRGDYRGAAQGLSLYIYSGKEVMPGLVKRRERERQMFLAGLDADEDERAIAATERVTPASPDKPLSRSSTVWAGVTGALSVIGGYVQNATGLAPTYQGWILGAALAIGLGGLVWAVVERIRKRNVAEGW